MRLILQEEMKAIIIKHYSMLGLFKVTSTFSLI